MDDTAGEAAATMEEWAVPLGERRPTFASMAFESTHLFLGTGPVVLGVWFLFETVVLGGFLVLLSVPSPGMLLTDPSSDWLSAVLAAASGAGFLLRLLVLVLAYFVLRSPVAGAVAAYGAARQRRVAVRFRVCVLAGLQGSFRVLGGSLVLGALVAAALAALVGGLTTLAASTSASTGLSTAGFLIPAALLVAMTFFYGAAGLSLWTPAAVIEDAGPVNAVARAWSLSRSYRWSIGAAYLVLESLALAVTWILLAFVGYLGSLDFLLSNAGLFQVLVAVVVALPLLGAALMESFFTLGSASAYNLIVAADYTQASRGAGTFEPPSGYGPSMGTIARRP